MNKKRTTSTRRRATTAIVAEYLRDTLDWARENRTARANNIGMGAADLLAKVEGQVASTGLAEAMGYTGPLNGKQDARDSFTRDVLLGAQATLDEFGADADAAEVASGVAAAGRLSKSDHRPNSDGALAYMMRAALGIFTDDVDGREHDHSLGPPRYSPPRGWPCCADLPGQRPTSWHADDLSELVTGTADYPIEAYDLPPDELAVLRLLEAERNEAEA